MPRLGGRLLAVLSIAVFAANAGAQKSCDIDEGSPNQVSRAKLQLSLAQQTPGKPTVIPQLKDATKLLYDGDMKKNATGRAFVLGETMVLWTLEPGMENGFASRGALGFTTDTAAKVDLFQTVDSAFTIVETAMPECMAQVGQWRQQKPWVDLVNHAMELANGGQVDSAAVLAKRSLLLSKNAPYGFYVLAQQAQKNNQPKEVIAEYKLAIASAKDSSQADTKRTFMFQLGGYAADQAESAKGDDKKYYQGEAKAAFDMLAKDPGTKFGDAARQGLARLAAASGDTAAIKASYADALANPGAFSYAQLMNAAVTAARTNQNRDAIKLFDAARKLNPYHRDALFNLGRLYVLDSMYKDGIPVLRQLIAVDPNNPTNYQLMAAAYAAVRKQYDSTAKAYDARSQALGKRANAPGAKAATVKAAIDSAARLAPAIKAYEDSAKTNLDSALKYNALYSDSPVAVSFNDFTPGDAKTTIGGTIGNMTDAAKSYTLKIDFLDKTGNVVNTQTVQVGPVGPKQQTSWHTEGIGAGIVAFRYAPIT